MFIVKQNTSVVIPVFVCDASGNGVSGTLTVKLKKNGSDFSTITPTVSADANVTGWYNITLTSFHTDTLGVTVLRAEATGAIPQHVVFLVAASDWGTVDNQLVSISDQVGKLTFDVNNNVYASVQQMDSTVIGNVWNYDESGITSGVGNRIKTNLDTSTIASAVWSNSVRTLTSFGTLASDVASAILGSAVEGSYTVVQYLRLFAAALLGKVSGAQSNTPVFRDVQDTKNRISMTVDNDGNRTSVTLDGS